MSARSYALMTGLFVIVLFGLIAAVAYWFGGSHVPRDNYIVVASQSVMGLHGQSTVSYRGVPVGDVSKIRLAPNNAQKTLITISINESIPVTTGTYATLRTKGVTGLAALELNDNGTHSQRLPSSASRPARIPLRGGAGGLTSAGKQVAAKLNALADSLQDILSPANRNRIDAILANTAKATEQLTELENKLDASLAGLPALTADARHTLHRADKLTKHLIRLTDSLHQLSGKTQDFVDNGKDAARELARQTLPKLGTTMEDLQETAHALRDLSHSLENNPQQLLFGPVEHPPGPGEPRFEKPSSKD